jgi:hypothetical protein
VEHVIPTFQFFHQSVRLTLKWEKEVEHCFTLCATLSPVLSLLICSLSVSTSNSPVLLPLTLCPYIELINVMSLSLMNNSCSSCHALHWFNEKIVNSSKTSPLFLKCCYRRKVHLDALPDPPEPLRTLLTGDTTEAKEFRVTIRYFFHLQGEK